MSKRNGNILLNAALDQQRAATHVVFPGVIVVDTREQLPYTFQGFLADANYQQRPLIIRSLRRRLPTGDYSLAGHEGQVAVERKSIEDLWGTLGKGRDRFERELARLNALKWAAVVIEAGWDEMFNCPPEGRKLTPKVIFRSILSYQQRFPRVHWLTMPGRREGEIATFRILQRWWLAEQKQGWTDGGGI